MKSFVHPLFTAEFLEDPTPAHALTMAMEIKQATACNDSGMVVQSLWCGFQKLQPPRQLFASYKLSDSWRPHHAETLKFMNSTFASSWPVNLFSEDEWTFCFFGGVLRSGTGLRAFF